MLVFYYYC